MTMHEIFGKGFGAFHLGSKLGGTEDGYTDWMKDEEGNVMVDGDELTVTKTFFYAVNERILRTRDYEVNLSNR
jgi:hypothetical protein